MQLDILHTAASYPPDVSGVSHVLQTISEKLAGRGHRVTVATSLRSGRHFSRLNGVEIREFDISGRQVVGYTGNVQSYTDFIRSFCGDVMMNYAALNWTSDLVHPLLGDLKCAKVFIPCGYSDLHNPAYAAYFETMPQVLNKYDHIVYHSENYQDKFFGDQNNIRHYSIIPNGALAEEFLETRKGFREKYGIHSARMFVCVSNYSHLKNQEMVLRAYLEANVADSTLVFIGHEFNKYAWEQLHIKSSANGLSILLYKAGAKVRRHIWNRIFPAQYLRGTSRSGLEIRLFEKVPRDMIVAAYHEADMFLFGSQVECFPLVIVEAMASGTPFVTTDCGNVGKLPGGIVISSVAEMAQVIRLLADKGREWNSLTQAGRQAWEQKYRWDKIVDAYEKLYLKLVDKSEKNKLKSTVQ